MLFRDIVTSLSSSHRTTESNSNLTFYIRRIGQETAGRATAAALIVVVMLFQMVTFVFPPQASNASSPNDIIPGGFSSKADLLKKVDAGGDTRVIYNYFGITRADIANKNTVEVTITGKQGLYSLGRNHKFANDIAMNIPGAGTPTYLRPLADWGVSVHYKALRGTNSRGEVFYIMTGCGNVALPKIPNLNPPLPAPPKTIPVPGVSFRCDKLTATPDHGTSPMSVNFDVATTLDNTTVNQYRFEYGDGDAQVLPGPHASHRYQQPGTYTAKVRLTTLAGTTDYSAACSATITVDSPPTNPELHFIKTATNLGQKDGDAPTDANNATAKAGDRIRYDLIVNNSGDGDYKNYIFNEDISDILEYADLRDIGDGLKTVKAGDTLLSWKAETIKAGSKVTKSFIVQVKDPIPAKPASSTDPLSFDLKMDNVFEGQVVRVLLPPPTVAKQIEVTAATLPDTGSNLPAVVFIALAVVSVFLYLRNRLMKRELEILQAHPEYYRG